MSILGTHVQRTEDPALLTVGGSFIADLDLPGQAWVVYVRSTVAHGRIVGIDLTDAREMPGVVGIVTAADLDLPPAPPVVARVDQSFVRPYLAMDTVRFVGDLVAAVVAETYAQAVDAAEAVVVDIEPLPAVADLRRACDDEVLVHAASGTNTCMRIDGEADPNLFDGCEVVTSVEVVNQRIAPVPLEPRAGSAWWSEDGRLHVYSCSQGAHAARSAMAGAHGLDPAQVQVITPDVGGGFGAKHGNEPEEILLPWLARRHGRPMRWVETRTESMLTLVHGRGQIQRITIGGHPDGKVVAYRLEITQDAGAYPNNGAALPMMTRLMASGVYDIQRVECTARSVVTNTTPVGAYRGAGRPEATAAIERAMDVFARALDMDPAEVRRRNLITPEQFPYETTMGSTYDTGRYAEALERALRAAGYEALRADQQRRRQRGDVLQLGIGLSTYVEITNPFRASEYGSMRVRPDGGAVVLTGSSAHGQGHHTVYAMLASEATGIPLDRIDVRHGDTDEVVRGSGTGGSKSLQIGGSAVAAAAEQLVEQARQLAADHLEADPADVVLDRSSGVFHVTGTPARAIGWADLAATNEPDALWAETDYKAAGSTFPFGAHVSVVEVDTETGSVRVVRHIAVDDAGRIINPLIVDGQVHGGIAAGIAQALLEEVRYDADANPVTTNLADYAAISATEVPMFERVPMETTTPLNQLGVKGIGEAGTIGATPAVQNAVIDALAHLGVVHADMPLTPERVWAAITSA